MNIQDAKVIAKQLAKEKRLTVNDFQAMSGLAVSRVRFWLDRLRYNGFIVKDPKQTEAHRKTGERGRPILYWKWIGA